MDQGCDLFWVEARGESTGKEVIIGLGFHIRFKKINKLSGTAAEPSNSISLHTKFSKMRKKKKLNFTNRWQFLLSTSAFPLFSLCLVRSGTYNLQLPWVPALKTINFIWH